MNSNEPVAWMVEDDENISFIMNGNGFAKPDASWKSVIPVYTHPAKELHLSLQKSKETGELLAVTYTDDEHRIVEVLWKKPPAKTLTDEELVESLAELEHEQWIKWASTIMQTEKISDGRIARWKDCFKPYSELSEEMKEFDREWARKALAILKKG